MPSHQSLIANVFNTLLHQDKGNTTPFEPVQSSYTHQILGMENARQTKTIFLNPLQEFMTEAFTPRPLFS